MYFITYYKCIVNYTGLKVPYLGTTLCCYDGLRLKVSSPPLTHVTPYFKFLAKYKLYFINLNVKSHLIYKCFVLVEFYFNSN